ncbi:hypothetical protein PV08_04450 [Exophiala spinifera]|uniref:Heterokaryon incompatibility domain-containing protein n=1 Tax=Exophiala spinifera TaxID=91928 RepID=A0A0D2C0Q6_9EURO|nr:uncharacterized protein PV08_04450 [Exophiala spinifera]KIW17259.1 hypothetical protein PV08_04450 [Exophiala spinifera]
MLPRLHVPVSSDSDTCFDTIQSWIKECVKHHKLCDATSSEGLFLPTRLVDVTPDDCDKEIRLVNTRYISKSSKYAALSHSWGRREQRIKPIPKTTTKTLKARLRGVSFGELTKTFQDAVSAVRRLGLRYVWIDSLCIIQDDDNDFAEQASQMAKIYGQAHLVISALRAATGDVGIFHRRYKPEAITHSSRRGPSLTAYVRPVLNHDDFITGEPRSFQSSPLFARAWCFQERLLARRVVHFSEHEIVWECNEELDCECRAIRPDSLAEMNGNFKRRQAAALRSKHQESLLKAWYDVVRAYSARTLTMETDRLPALSGFAQLVNSPGFGKYSAGLWEGQMPAALLWRPLRALPEAPDGLIERPAEYRAPTWAWPAVVAVTRGYMRYMTDSDIVARVVKIRCTPSTSDPFGQVKSGYIVLEAPVVDLILSLTKEKDSWPHLYDLERGGEKRRFQADVSLGKRSSDHVRYGARLRCVLIERSHTQKRTASIVLRHDESDNEHWYRVGWFNCPQHWASEAQREQFKIL